MQPTDFRFESIDVPMETTQTVRERLAQGRSCVVHGAAGTGKTHAVRAAVNGALWVDLAMGDELEPALFVDLARQVERGRDVLAAYAMGDIETAADTLIDRLGDRVLVVDGVERLRRRERDAGWDDPAELLRRSTHVDTIEWLVRRAGAAPTVFVGRRRLNVDSLGPIRHKAPSRSTLKLNKAKGGYRDWPGFCRQVQRRPAALLMGRALVPLVSASGFNAFVADLRDSEFYGDAAIREVGLELRRAAPASWLEVLALIAALRQASQSVLAAVLTRRDLATLDALRQLGLLERHRVGGFSVPLVLLTTGVVGAADVSDELLTLAAARLLDEVNNPSDLTPEHAGKVFQAHSLYRRVGDFDGARRTARLHVSGLVSLAKETSRARRFADASRQYASIRDIVDSLPPGARNDRIRSYVVHYHAFNGRRGKLLPLPQVERDYGAARQLWPENALWHGRYVALLAELGRREDARAALGHAEEQVPIHPRRDWTLRVRHAQSLHSAGVVHFALELIEPVLGVSEQSDPDSAAAIRSLLSLWEQGVDVTCLDHLDGWLVFNRPQRIALQYASAERWIATSPRARTAATGTTAIEALRALGERIKRDCQRLMGTPGHRLTDADLRRKGLLIGLIDVMSSDLGLPLVSERWILGRIVEGRFVAQQRDWDPFPIDPNTLLGVDVDDPGAGLWFGRLNCTVDGHLSGDVTHLEPAGSGRSLAELLAFQRDLVTADDVGS